jgi:hypothetical protein
VATTPGENWRLDWGSRVFFYTMAATEPAKDPSGSGLDSNASASGKASESVEAMMGNLKLTAAEADKLIIDDKEEEVVKLIWALAGKILAPKKFHYNTIAEAMRPAWGNLKGLVFHDGGPNLFIAEFGCEWDRDRVWCGEFVRLDTNKEGHVVGCFLRARAFMKVNEPIQR